MVNLTSILTSPRVLCVFSLFKGNCLNDPFSEFLDLFPQLRNRKRDFYWIRSHVFNWQKQLSDYKIIFFLEFLIPVSTSIFLFFLAYLMCNFIRTFQVETICRCWGRPGITTTPSSKPSSNSFIMDLLERWPK